MFFTIIYSLVLIVTFTLIGFGLYYENKIAENNNDEMCINANISTLPLGDHNSPNDSRTSPIIEQQKIIEPPTTFRRIVKCFSIRDNFNWLIKVDTTPSSIPVINGLR